MTNSTWRKSSYSGGQGGDCVEVMSDANVMIRDTKSNGTGPVLTMTPDAFRALLRSVR